MFDWFGKKEYIKPEVPSMDVDKEEEKKLSGKVFYRLGLTDTGRVAFNMGYSEITMNRAGCQQMIDQLTFYMNQIPEEENVQSESEPSQP